VFLGPAISAKREIFFGVKPLYGTGFYRGSHTTLGMIRKDTAAMAADLETCL